MQLIILIRQGRWPGNGCLTGWMTATQLWQVDRARHSHGCYLMDPADRSSCTGLLLWGDGRGRNWTPRSHTMISPVLPLCCVMECCESDSLAPRDVCTVKHIWLYKSLYMVSLKFFLFLFCSDWGTIPIDILRLQYIGYLYTNYNIQRVFPIVRLPVWFGGDTIFRFVLDLLF